jgi:flagellar protein FlaG
MALDVSSIQSSSPLLLEQAKRGSAPEEGSQRLQTPVELPADLKSAIQDLQRVSEVYNRHLSFSFNEKLDQVVVKVIDNDTDKVVREIPPVELQQVYERIREVIGLLFDKSA